MNVQHRRKYDSDFKRNTVRLSDDLDRKLMPLIELPTIELQVFSGTQDIPV